jgi:Flp pilus assembly protein TadB
VKDTDTPVLEKRSYSSPLSFVGATSRLVRLPEGIGNVWLLVAAWTAVALGLLVVWALLLCWYAVAFGVFGVLTFPWRWHRRSQRKAQHLAEAQLALLQRNVPPGKDG